MKAALHSFELDAVDYIAKPIQPLIVLARVRTQLEPKLDPDIADAFLTGFGAITEQHQDSA